MPILLDAKDLAAIDREYAAESSVWSVLAEGAKSITDADFVGANEVRVNRMAGFCGYDYRRNLDNNRGSLTLTKETVKLEYEQWMSYDLDALDMSENSGLTAVNVVENHVLHVTIPDKDCRAVIRLLQNVGERVAEEITSENALEAFDNAEQYMIDQEVTGPFVMLASSDYYRALKNCEGVSRTFSTTTANIAGIDRQVSMLDNGIPIVKVPAGRLQMEDELHINFFLLPLRAAAPIEKFNDVTLIPAESDRRGYRDTIKGLNYYDLIVFENARKGIYLSYSELQ